MAIGMFDNVDILARLKPLAHTGGGETENRPGLFMLNFSAEDEPSVNYIGKIENIPYLAAADRMLAREIQRADNTGTLYSGWDADITMPVSLYDNPHLISMIIGRGNLLYGSSIVTFPEITGRIVLKLTDREVANVATALVLRYDDKEFTDFHFLNEDYVLVETVDSKNNKGAEIISIAPVGMNFAGIRQLIIDVEKNQLTQYLSLFLSYFDNIDVTYNGVEAVRSNVSEKSVPTIVLEKVAADQALYMRVVQTEESSNEAPAGNLVLTKIVDSEENHRLRIRNIEFIDIKPWIAELRAMIDNSAPSRTAKKEIYQDDNFFIIPAETASPFLYNCLPTVLQKFKLLGSDKLREYKITPAMPKLKLNLSSGIDFLEGEAQMEIGEQKFTLADILDQFKRNRYVQLNDGNRAIIDERYIRRLQRIFNLKGKKDKIKVSVFDLPEIEDLIQDRIKGDAVKRSRQMFEGFNTLRNKRLPKLPVKAKLRSYQKDGVKWIKYLYDINMGGCLADDMGLGKTLQTISMLSLIYPEAERPTLIVMPRSLLFNWQNEFEKFAPQIKIATYYGTDRNIESCLGANVILTTYAVVRNDIETFKDIHFEYVVLDESQNIKNIAAQTTQAVTVLKADHRLALSGTPMENNLTELYSLYRFLNPAMFGSLEDFNSAYTYPIQKNGDNEAMQSLRRKIFPFMLRRLKKEVLSELPDRIEHTLYVDMNAAQAKFYEQRRLEYLEQIHNTIAAEGIQKSQFVMFQALNELRRISSVPESLTDGKIHSPKIDELMDQVASALESGHKTVIFFNYIAGLELVGQRLQQMGVDFEEMTGSTTAANRKRIVEKFQNDSKCMVLLMTLKVGGVGLNLTAADTVFIFEPWWNKAAEEQAINRLHRIGQKAVVNSFSIITSGTIEEKILQLQQQKKDLFDGLIGSDGASTKHLTEEDIDFILS